MAADPFAGSRLPSLPNAGYATARERQVSDLIMMFIRELERSRITLLDIVCSGRGKFRSVCHKALRGMKLETELVDAIYDYLALLAGENPAQQLQTLLLTKSNPPWLQQQESLTPQQSEARVRDSLAVVAAVNRGDRRIEDLRKRIK